MGFDKTSLNSFIGFR